MGHLKLRSAPKVFDLHLKYKSGCVSYLSSIPKSPQSFFYLMRKSRGGLNEEL